MSILEDNIARVEALYPRFRTEIADMYVPAARLSSEASKTGLPTAHIDGRYLHSKYNPKTEADRIIYQRCASTVRTGVFLGFGLGYLVEAFMERFPETPVIIIEKDPSLFLKALSIKDFTALFSRHVSIILGIDPAEISGALSSLGNQPFHIIPLIPIVETCEEYYLQVENILKSRLSRYQVNRATLNRFGKRWIRNLAGNLDIISTAGDVGMWRAAFSSIPSVIAAAGPTLDELLPLLPDLAERAVIISSDTAARALLRIGVTPDFIIVVDPQYWNSRHLDGLDLSDSILVSESATHPDIFRGRYRSIYFSGSLFPLGAFLEGERSSRMKLGAGGSVATTAWDFARLIGSSRIVAAGLDLGFPDLQTHFRGCYFEQRLFTLNSRFKPYEQSYFQSMKSGAPFQAEDFNGRPVLTDRRLVVYKQWFEEQLAHPSSPSTLTISSRGMRISGIEAQSPETVLSWPMKRNEINTLKKRVLNLDGTAGEPIGLRLKKLILDLQKLKQTADRGVQAVSELLPTAQSGGDDIHALQLRALDDIDRDILNISGRNVAGFLINPLLEEIQQSQPEQDTLENNLNTSLRLYTEIAKAADFHIQLFSKYNSQK